MRRKLSILQAIVRCDILRDGRNPSLLPSSEFSLRAVLPAAPGFGVLEILFGGSCVIAEVDEVNEEWSGVWIVAGDVLCFSTGECAFELDRILLRFLDHIISIVIFVFFVKELSSRLRCYKLCRTTMMRSK
jgi:hypothetical protein